jgi:beta-glucosidase
MDRRDWLIKTGLGSGALFIGSAFKAAGAHGHIPAESFTRADFGPGFTWGVAAASYQTEGAWNLDGKGESTWDRFSRKKGAIERGENADVAADFYHRYQEDIGLIKSMNFKAFRFSLSWPRILPKGTGTVNQKGIDLYHRVIDNCLEAGLDPWITLYHWDLPQMLEEKGGWTNREILNWFSEYTEVVSRTYADKVKNWMVMNEQLSFTGGGYMQGLFAPGRKSLGAFLKAVHHSVLCNAEGGRILRKNIPAANIGTTYATTWVEAVDEKEKNQAAASRVDAIMNRLFIEPALGMGYPEDSVPLLRKIKSYYREGDEARMVFDFDFNGIQYYFRTVAEKSWMPGMRAREIPPSERGVPANEMEGEIYPDGLYQIIKKFSNYKGIRNIHITENGTCVPDSLVNGRVHDSGRIQYFKDHLSAVLKARKEGVDVKGYFVWSPTDNFEWNKGYRTRFGLVYIDFNTLERTIKDSGLWFRDFLK